MSETHVSVLECRCERCAWVWLPRKGRPRQCPRCKSALWDMPKDIKREFVRPGT